jgi:hypothetical protein
MGIKDFFKPKADSCMPDMNVSDEPIPLRDWSPYEFGVKIFVASDVSSAKQIAKSASEVQEQLVQQFKTDHPDTKLLMSVETFQDDCRHSTPWSESPRDITSQATRWHCYQTQTQYGNALNAMRGDTHANMIIMLGNRFDDNVNDVKAAAKALHDENGVRIFALPSASERENDPIVGKYTAVAESAGGLCLPLLPNETVDYGSMIREITQTVFAKVAGDDVALLPPPANDKTKQARVLLLEKLDM